MPGGRTRVRSIHALRACFSAGDKRGQGPNANPIHLRREQVMSPFYIYHPSGIFEKLKIGLQAWWNFGKDNQRIRSES